MKAACIGGERTSAKGQAYDTPSTKRHPPALTSYGAN